MAGLIPQSFIDELLARADIVALIDARVPLRKAGRDFQARCPFHDEKTPSFTVSPTKQFYHCFGCGAHGTALGFLMEYERLDFPDAVEELARPLGLEVPHEGGDSAVPVESTEGLRALALRVDAWFQTQLREHPQRARGVDYLKRRGVDGPTAAHFGLGFAPPGWDGLLGALGGEKEQHADLLRLGLLVERDDGHCYDRFRDRITFPIRDRRGRVVGFGGRALGDDPPKYLNSPESLLFHKGRELYGFHEARQAQRQLERLLVVEGYMDVVALAQHEVLFAVATLGTATTADHLETLYRATPEVVFCFDGDRAGRQAAWRALEQALPAQRDGRQARFLFLPEGDDPDSLVRREGGEAFLERIAGARPLSEVLFDELASQVDMESVDGRARLAELARPLLGKVPDGVFREMLIDSLGEIVHLPAKKLSKLVLDERPVPRAGRSSGQAAERQGPSTERAALAALLRQPDLAEGLPAPQYWNDLGSPGVSLLGEMIAVLHESPGLTTAALLERWREHPVGRHLYKLLRDDDPNQVENIEQVFADAHAQIDARARKAYAERRHQELSERGFERLSSEEKGELQRLIRWIGGQA